MLMPKTKAPRQTASRKSLVVLLLLLLGLSVAAYNRQALYDFARLYNYQPPAEVALLARQTTMTPQAEHSFYVNHPAIQDRSVFNASCPNNGGEQTIVLGCYIPRQRGIYVFKVTDPQLNGVQQVTAAHEMLHSAYDRLSRSQRDYVDGLLQGYYAQLKDKRLLAVFEAYKKTEPNDVTNEMHSIFGSEVANLPAPLEDYYRQYFTNRQAVATFASQYQAAFTSRRTLIADYDQQLTSLKQEIDAKQRELASQEAALTSQRKQLNSLAASNPAAYNAQVDQFNNAVRQYNALLANTKQKVDSYNQLIEKRNAIAIEEQDLSRELDSRLQTQSAQ